MPVCPRLPRAPSSSRHQTGEWRRPSHQLGTLGVGTLRAGKHFLGPGAHRTQADARLSGCHAFRLEATVTAAACPAAFWKARRPKPRRKQQIRRWQAGCRDGAGVPSRRLTTRPGPGPAPRPAPPRALSFCSAAKPRRGRDLQGHTSRGPGRQAAQAALPSLEVAWDQPQRAPRTPRA